MSGLVHNLDREGTAEALLIDIFKQKDNFLKLLSSYTEQTQEVEDVLFSLLNDFWLSTATGPQLDAIGEVVGVERDAASDVQYSLRIGARIRLNVSSGTPNQILALVRVLLPASSGNPKYIILPPASFVIDAVDSSPLNATEIEEIGEVLDSAAPAGVRGGFVYSLSAPGDTFTLSSLINTDQSSTQLGLADDAETTGGRLAQVY